jgi:hypothetical protein
VFCKWKVLREGLGDGGAILIRRFFYGLSPTLPIPFPTQPQLSSPIFKTTSTPRFFVRDSVYLYYICNMDTSEASVQARGFIAPMYKFCRAAEGFPEKTCEEGSSAAIVSKDSERSREYKEQLKAARTEMRYQGEGIQREIRLETEALRVKQAEPCHLEMLRVRLLVHA